MKQYRHKKTGKIAETDSIKYYNIEGSDYKIPSIFIEDSNDWELIEKKDYEILSFHSNNVHDRILKNTYGNGFLDLVSCNTYSESHCLEWNYKIYSVKRLSDGEIFTIGDILQGGAKIDEIYYEDFGDRKKLAFFDKKEGGGNFLSNIKKARKLLFKTEDNIDIYDGDRYWWVHNEHFIIHTDIAKEDTMRGSKCCGILDFSTKETAEEWIIKNKPVLSYLDIEKVWFMQVDNLGTFRHGLKELVKSKIK